MDARNAQYSATSQAVFLLRAAAVEGRNASAGQVIFTPSHASAASHAVVAVRHTVPRFRGDAAVPHGPRGAEPEPEPKPEPEPESEPEPELEPEPRPEAAEHG